MKAKQRNLNDEKVRRAQDEDAARAYEEFVNTFQDTGSSHAVGKTWVKAGTFNAGNREEDKTDQGKLYKPTSKFTDIVDKHIASVQDSPPKKPDRGSKRGKNKDKEKKKSNLEIFKEELKIIQEERNERHRVKGMIPGVPPPSKDSRFEIVEPTRNMVLSALERSLDPGDPNTTNLYLGNLNPKLSEQQLMELFGQYGPLASIKIMWPRSEEERSRGKNCGFVAFMRRRDGEKAYKMLLGKQVMGYEMKLGWGKSVPIPSHPVYIPQSMIEVERPPPPSGLPFNAQPCVDDRGKIPPPGSGYPGDEAEQQEFNQILSRAVVKVVIPTERVVLCLIHRMIEFVVREGPMFEAIIMNREINNPMFRFLFENQSPAHCYYRWKLFSILQGDVPTKWSTKPFRMFKGGSIWRPPKIHPSFLDDDEEEPAVVAPPVIPTEKKGALTNSQRDTLEDLLRNLTPERGRVAEATVFCVEHAESAEEICECIAESLSIPQTPMPKKMARLYLVSDILHNCSVKVANVSYYRKGFQSLLVEIFKNFKEALSGIESRLKAEAVKQKVMCVFRAWEDWNIYPVDFLITLQNHFIGILSQGGSDSDKEDDLDGIPLGLASLAEVAHNNCIDGAPLCDIDGAPLDETDGDDEAGPLDGMALLRGAQRSNDIDAEIDGMPIVDDVDGVPMEETAKPDSPKMLYAPSKWETVDPSEVESQAITTSKWEMLERGIGAGDDMVLSGGEGGYDRSLTPSPVNSSGVGESLGGRGEMSEEKRARLRVIETKVMLYQDELESGQRPLKHGYTLVSQVDRYRKKLLHKAEKEIRRESVESIPEKPDKRHSSTEHKHTHSRGSDDDTERYSGQYTSSSSTHRSQHSSRSKTPPSRSRRTSKKNRSRSRSPRYSSYSKDRAPAISPPHPLSRDARRPRSISRSASRSPPRKHRRKSSRR